MKKYMVLFCLALLPMTMRAQLDCGDIDMICNKAMELANSGQYSKALEGLRNAKDLPALRNCSNIYKIDNAISKIQNMQTPASSISIDGDVMTVYVGNVSFRMIRVEGGTFTMGATSEQGSDADKNEKPTHNVNLSSYYIGETEVTQELWIKVMDKNPIPLQDFNRIGSRLPVSDISWEECQLFIGKLNKLTGKSFRLPTEAEWEYAARGRNGTSYKYSGSNSIGEVAWYTENCRQMPHVVGSKRPNELGLYDMSGNVSEWCWDKYGKYPSSSQIDPTGSSWGTYKIHRGGSWSSIAKNCRVSCRGYDTSSHQLSHVGLRLAL